MSSEKRMSGDALILPLDYELSKTEREMRRLTSALVIFVSFVIGVAAIAPVRQVAVATGEIAPSSAVAEVRHVEGGEVGEIHVRAGDVVAQGAPLLSLRPVRIEADLRRLSARRAHLALRAERLLALMEGRAPELEAAVGGLSGDGLAGADAAAPDWRRDLASGVIDNERALHRSELEAFEQRMAALGASEERRLLEAEGRRAEVSGLRVETAALQERLAMREELRRRGVISQDAVLELRGLHAEAQARLAAADAAARSAEGAAAEARSEMAQLRAERRSAWSTAQIEAAAEIAELDREITKLRDQLDRLVVRSPIGGRVLDLGGLTIGGVAVPGAIVAHVVPATEELIAEVRISPEDVGHVTVGSEAKVTVTTFDRDVFGDWRGVITQVSPAAFENERGDRYFSGRLRLEPGRGQDAAGADAPPLTAGMTVNADILTGSKSILGYLFSPIVEGVSRAFSER